MTAAAMEAASAAAGGASMIMKACSSLQ